MTRMAEGERRKSYFLVEIGPPCHMMRRRLRWRKTCFSALPFALGNRNIPRKKTSKMVGLVWKGGNYKTLENTHREKGEWKKVDNALQKNPDQLQNSEFWAALCCSQSNVKPLKNKWRMELSFPGKLSLILSRFLNFNYHKLRCLSQT